MWYEYLQSHGIPLTYRFCVQLPEVTPGILSVLRALRVLRPLRTLRLLGDITLVAQCITSAAGLFRDAMFFVIFLITLFCKYIYTPTLC